eukprot:gene10067-10222_t
MQIEVSNLPRGLHARCIAFHPLRPILAVGIQSCVGAYDLMTGVRLGRVDIRTPPVAMLFSRDGSLLVVATQEWHIIGINTSNWRSRVLAPFTEARNTPLDSIMMAITGGSRPVVFFTRYGKNSIRMAVNAADRKLKWGVKLKLDVNKAVVGLAAHPTTTALLVIFDDGTMRGYGLSPNGLQPLWPSVFALPGDTAALLRLSVTPPLFQALPHPFIDGACLLAIGGGSGNILVMEVAGRGEPRPVLKTVIQGSLPIVGLGVYQPEHVLFVFGARPNANNVHVTAWQMYNQAVPSGPGVTSGLSFEPIVVDIDALDTPSAATASTMGSKALALKSAGAANGSSAAPAAPGFDWQSLWGVEVNEGVLDNIAEHSFLLALGCVAVQRAPPLALREAHNIMQQRLGLISAPEAAITRRTVAVPLLRLLHAGHPGKMWPGGRVAPLHTGLHFWQAAAGLSKYSLASKRSGVFAELPTAAGPDAGSKSSREAKQLVHSAKQHAWLVFLEVTGGALAAADSGSKGASSSWLWTLVTDSAAAAAGEGRWYLPGSSGVFLGPQDLYFGILPEHSSTDSMIPVLGVGSGYLQHAGQGASGAKGRGPRQHQQHDTHEEEGQLHGGGGVVLWQGGESQVLGEHSLQLQRNERLLSVAWQNTSSSTPLEPHQCAAAILTTQRLMLVSGDLTLLAAVPASCGSVGLSNAITSFLWVGPALLYMTAAGQVMQLMWTGQSQHMASVASQPPALLAGALADSLLLVRQNPATGQDEALLEAFDASHVTSSMLWSLIQAWCGDVAAALALHAADVEPSVQLAANAAAGRWGSVVTSLRSEHQNSVFYPKPAAPGSQLHYKLLAAAAGAVMHGQFQEAQQCLQAAGEWESFMALAVSYEKSGRTFSVTTRPGQSSDWRLRAVMADNTFFSNAADWTFGGPGKLPAMETSSFNAPAALVQESEVGQVPRADTTTLGAYLGNSDLVLQEAALGAHGAAAAAGGLPGSGGGSESDFLANMDQLVALSSKSSAGANISPDGKPGIARSPSAGSSISSDTGLEGGCGALQRQRDPFSFYDDEDDDDDGTSFGYKFRIHIKAVLEVSKRRLARGRNGKTACGGSSTSGLEESPSGGPDSLYDLSFLGRPAQAQASSSGVGTSGVAEMQSADWNAAAESFTQTLQALLSEASGPSRAQRQAFASQYLAAVMLLKAAGAGTGAKEARLYRYAASLRLDDRHSLALVKESVVRNKHVGNYKYAADQLTWLVARSLGSAPMEVMTRLQEDIDECDRKGGSNASIPPEEQLDEWVSLVASATSRQEVEDVVQPVLAM